MIKIVFLVLLTVIITYSGSNMIVASSIRVTQEQAELIEWCSEQMVRVTDANMVQALNICAKYYLSIE